MATDAAAAAVDRDVLLRYCEQATKDDVQPLLYAAE